MAFNGKRKLRGLYGEDNAYDYGMRIYDSRVGRFLSVDPLTGKYAYYSPYQFAGNNPIKFVDLDGMEPSIPEVMADKYAKNMLSIKGANFLINNVYNPLIAAHKAELKTHPEKATELNAYLAANKVKISGLYTIIYKAQRENNEIKKLIPKADQLLFFEEGFDNTTEFAQNFMPLLQRIFTRAATQNIKNDITSGKKSLAGLKEETSPSTSPANTKPEPESLDWTRVNRRTGETAPQHVNLHGQDDPGKPSHGIFYGDPVQTTDRAWAMKGNAQPLRQTNGNDSYTIPYPNAGYAGGSKGTGENLNYIRIITESGTNKIVTSFPVKQ